METEKENAEKKIEIVPATPEDARGIAEVFYKTWLATYPNEEFGITTDDIEDRFKDSFTEEGLKKSRERIQNAKNQQMLLAKEGDRVIGVVRLTFYPNKNQLQAIYVLPEYQGQGVGKMLWMAAQKLFDPTKDIIVQVATYNTPAIEFYKKLGFVDTGKRWSDEKFRMKSGAVIPEMEMIMKVK